MATIASFNRKSFVSTLRMVTLSTAKRSPKPAARLCKITLNGSGVFESTTLEHSLEMELNHISKAGDDCTFLADPRELFKAAELLDGDSINLLFDGDNCSVQDSSATYFVETMKDASEFPITSRLLTDDNARSVTIHAHKLLASITATRYSMDSESCRYALGGLLMEFAADGRGFVVGTDGRRLARYLICSLGTGNGKRKITGNPKVSKALTALIPGSFIPVLASALRIAGTVTIRFSKNAVEFEMRKPDCMERLCTLNTMQMEGRFPKWRTVVPADSIQTGTFSVNALIPAFERAVKFSIEENRGGTIKTFDDTIALTMEHVDKRTFRDAVEFPNNCPQVARFADGETCLDVRFVCEFLKACKTIGLNNGNADLYMRCGAEPPADDRAENWQVTDGRPTMFVCGPLLYVICPMARDR